MSNQNSFKNTIKSYLDERARTDELFAKSYEKPNKNLGECCDYIMGEAKKRGNAVAISDEEVFGMAVHYYDENDIKVSKLPAGHSVDISSLDPIPMVLGEEDKKTAREEAIKRLAEEQYALLKKKPTKTKKEANEVQQMSLF